MLNLNKLRERAASQEGFTLIELLVVMLILGILAAIAIPAFFSQRDKARDSDAKQAARTAQTSIEAYATSQNGEYTGATPAILRGLEPTLNDDPGDTLAVVAGARTYTVTVTSDATGTFSIERLADGTTNLLCSKGGEDGCPTGGSWE